MTVQRWKLKEVNAFSRRVFTRIPFRFGRSTMTEMPIIHLRILFENAQGSTATGISACGIPPLWFDKSPGKTVPENETDLLFGLDVASKAYLQADHDTVYGLHASLEPAIRKNLSAAGLNGLTAGFGIALLDAALIDGVCRFTGTPFHAALRSGLLDVPGNWPELLPASPVELMAYRHTIGLADFIFTTDIPKAVGDGLPESLEQVIAVYKPRYFKIKVTGNPVESLERLKNISRVLEKSGLDYAATLDGNEQFPDMDSFASFMENIRSESLLKELWRRILWIEQPVARQASLSQAVVPALRAVLSHKPVIIDESDNEDSTIDTALSMGYSGVSAKLCKGVFRTLHSFKSIRETPPPAVPVLSSEDLTTVPVVPLHQDLCIAAALGITHSERNGHHYIRGFRFTPASEGEDALREFPSLYERQSDGIIGLRVENGMLSLREVNSHALGVRSFPAWDSMDSLSLPDSPAPTPTISEVTP